MYEIAGQIFSQLDAAFLVRDDDDGTFWLPSPPPLWWLDFSGTADYGREHPCAMIDTDPFLQHFLVDAQQHWDEFRIGNLRSGIWEVEVASGSTLALEAFAFTIESRSMLIIEDVRAAQTATTQGIQRSRTSKLELLRDIARRQQLEIELRDARDTAEQLERAKVQLLANTSHELRTPLAGMIGMLELACEAHPSAELAAALKSAHQLKRIVGDLLDFSALETGVAQVEFSKIDVADLLHQLHREFRPAAEEKGLHLTLSPTMVACFIESDVVRLRQVLSNLIDNALRYTSEGTVSLVAEEDATSVAVRVKDSGPGISLADQRSIFDAFRRGASSQIHDGGSGLGLSIAQRLAARLGGSLQIETTSRDGTTFCLQLPKQTGRGFSMPTPVDETEVPLALPKGLKVLVAEDSPINRNYVVSVLRQQGVDVDEVDNGLDLSDRAAESDYDIILTDCRMAGMTGSDAAQQIRQRGQHVPIIAITAHATDNETKQLKNAGINDILVKPYTKSELFRTILAHLPDGN